MIERTRETIRPVDLLAVLKRATTRPDWPPIVTSQEWREALAPVLNGLPCDAADALRYNHKAMSQIEFKEQTK